MTRRVAGPAVGEHLGVASTGLWSAGSIARRMQRVDGIISRSLLLRLAGEKDFG